MSERHHVVTTTLVGTLLGLCLGASTACGSGTVTGAASAASAASAALARGLDLARSPGPGQSPEPGTSGPGPGASATPGPGSPEGAAPVPEGFKRIGGPANGVTVAVPKEWVALDLTKDDLDKGLKDSGLTGPTLEQAKKSLRTLVDNNGIWASDTGSAKTSRNGFPTNLNAFCQAGRQISMEQLISETRSQLEQLNAKVVETKKMRIGSREAARIVYSFETNGVTVRGTQYYVPVAERTCIVTLSTDAGGKQELFDRIGETIRPV